MKRSIVLLLLLLAGVFQARSELITEDDIVEEGSGNLPDDEDGDGSGSGAPEEVPPTYKDEPEVKTPVVFPTKKPGMPRGKGKEGVLETAPTGEDDLSENTKNNDVSVARSVNFLQSPQFMAALIVGGCVGLLFAICVVMLLAYRMRKKDEGSYALDEQKKPVSPSYQYTQGQEYFA